ncbi:S-layer homology domain-containing protein [Bacillus thuringiensis]|uniref:S-layer homology domain-containing protein n=1 Tax=Bacillus thuringiensis TaxID=1428 RepID=UPI000BF9AAA4|nr:S-layer homology domain-containing protein [Bacillus thuringiensis]PFN48198.1 N-acetylmuramoyl-L-alanine amidase [Bacillus thuringiensis]
MSIRFSKKVVALSAGLTVLSPSLATFAEEQQEINNNRPITVQELDTTEQLTVSDEQALKSIKESFKDVDGRGIRQEEVTDKIEPAAEETGTLIVPNESNRVKDGLSSLTPRINSTINGVPFIEWIVPKGNPDIRPGYHMTPQYITIHETDNPGVGAGAKNHAQYLYNQATGKTDRAASWHFTVDDKEIYQHLPINENGWHAGDGNGAGNRQSIAIEIAVNRDGDYNKAVENAEKLAAYLMEETGVTLNNVVKHQKWSGKNCPAIMINRGQWNAFLNGVDKYYNDNPSITPPKDDITGGWYEPHVRELNRRGIMVGEGNGIFAPNRAVTRAEFAQLISKSLNLPNGSATFKDLNVAHPTLRDGIIRTASVGIIQGRGNGIFDPNASITREEAAIITDKAVQYKGIKGKEVSIPFTDQDQIYDKTYVQRLYSLGIVKGNGNNEFVPKGITTRGESAALLINMLQVIEGGNPQPIIGMAQINGIGVNIRSGAGTNYSVIRKATKGERVSVYEEKNGWLRISNKEWVFYDASYINYKKNIKINR